jgi:hypothetical protein
MLSDMGLLTRVSEKEGGGVFTAFCPRKGNPGLP